MTFSSIARCPSTGHLCLGVVTLSIAAGDRCEGIDFGAGVYKTRAYVKCDNELIVPDSGRDAGGQVGADGHLAHRSAA
ncbi:MAG: hypothetical protein AB7O88_09305 [Reyranellaceae bacterium]